MVEGSQPAYYNHLENYYYRNDEWEVSSVFNPLLIAPQRWVCNEPSSLSWTDHLHPGLTSCISVISGQFFIRGRTSLLRYQTLHMAQNQTWHLADQYLYHLASPELRNLTLRPTLSWDCVCDCLVDFWRHTREGSINCGSHHYPLINGRSTYSTHGFVGTWYNPTDHYVSEAVPMVRSWYFFSQRRS